MAEARNLARTLLRAGRAFPDYNMKHYIYRRVLDGFREQAALQGEAAAAALADARDQLALVRRQSVLYGFYSETHSVMDREAVPMWRERGRSESDG